MDEMTQTELQWQAVVNRDTNYDGRFVMAVVTTGIYCRPSCPARTPLRQNVRFFATPAFAEAAGYRACKRCAPNRTAYEIDMVTQLCRYIDQNFESPLDLKTLGQVVNLSPDYIQRVFKRIIGVSPRQYIQARRVGQLKANLRAGQDISAALYDAGFSSPSRIYEGVSHTLGMTPAAYRRRGKGMKIRYAVGTCMLGYLLVGQTERGLCEVSLGDSEDAVVGWLKHDYPYAEVERDDQHLAQLLKTIIALAQGDARQIELPLDLQASAFQLRVWDALRAIPYGETRSYQEIAKAINQPTAARAVAGACASNRIALVIPCHRVVRENGDAGGYRWGIERKAALQAHERETR
jgi:AraC family transcriptional regulator of adaptative response/methylated-DNA-[protein]-cysteine methyltransferase